MDPTIDVQRIETLLVLRGTSDAADRAFAEEAPAIIEELLGDSRDFDKLEAEKQLELDKADATYADAEQVLATVGVDLDTCARLGRCLRGLAILFEDAQTLILDRERDAWKARTIELEGTLADRRFTMRQELEHLTKPEIIARAWPQDAGERWQRRRLAYSKRDLISQAVRELVTTNPEQNP